MIWEIEDQDGRSQIAERIRQERRRRLNLISTKHIKASVPYVLTP